MYLALTSAQSRQAEDHAVAAGATVESLMRQAGAAVCAEVQLRTPVGRVIVVAGGGNNGGDGWVAAHDLHTEGREVTLVSLRHPDTLDGAAAGAARAAIEAGIDWRVSEGSPQGVLDDADVIVDALLGTGFSGELRQLLRSWCEAINSSGAYVISADVPSGVDADTGRSDESAVAADCTVTFIQPKLGLVTYPGAANAGQIVVAEIGVSREATAGMNAPRLWTVEEYADLLPRPAADAHKNSRGRVLVIAGSARFPGAAVLSARGAMRMGAGYVTLAVPAPVVPIAQSHLLAAPVVGLPADADGGFSAEAVSAAIELASGYDAVVLGPGLTASEGASAVARELFSRLAKPLVVDADALNALVGSTHLIASREAPTVLTPHPGELARLLGGSVSDVQSDRVSSCAELAGGSVAVVLKGAGSVVSDGAQSVIVTAGTPALATAGTGDVLSGMIGALLAQGVGALDAGALGAYVHGRAGEAAEQELTAVCMTAEDLPEYVPHAVSELTNVR
jgi:ADP-dependent NAD(P)H-hydrate dehydratase / NAD(P)H-hydrate epimerase